MKPCVLCLLRVGIGIKRAVRISGVPKTSIHRAAKAAGLLSREQTEGRRRAFYGAGISPLKRRTSRDIAAEELAAAWRAETRLLQKQESGWAGWSQTLAVRGWHRRQLSKQRRHLRELARTSRHLNSIRRIELRGERRVILRFDEGRHWGTHRQISEIRKAWRRSSAAKEIRRRKLNESARKWRKDRISREPHRRTIHSIRNRISAMLRSVVAGSRRGTPARSEVLTGCSWLELRHHLERQFKRGMTWENYGDRWHVDHILPVASFDLTKPEQVRQCFHWTNLRPLWAEKNFAKSDSITEPQMQLLLPAH